MAMAEYERCPVPPNAISTPWIRDIRTGVAATTTTGGHLWNASERLVGVTCSPEHAACPSRSRQTTRRAHTATPALQVQFVQLHWAVLCVREVSLVGRVVVISLQSMMASRLSIKRRGTPSPKLQCRTSDPSSSIFHCLAVIVLCGCCDEYELPCAWSLVPTSVVGSIATGSLRTARHN